MPCVQFSFSDATASDTLLNYRSSACFVATAVPGYVDRVISYLLNDLLSYPL